MVRDALITLYYPKPTHNGWDNMTEGRDDWPPSKRDAVYSPRRDPEQTQQSRIIARIGDAAAALAGCRRNLHQIACSLGAAIDWRNRIASDYWCKSPQAK